MFLHTVCDVLAADLLLFPQGECSCAFTATTDDGDLVQSWSIDVDLVVAGSLTRSRSNPAEALPDGMLLSPIPLLEASEGMKHSYDSCPRGNFVAYVPVRLLTLVYSVAFV